ncbi:MAG: hypothetical protein JXR19_05155 [Bacteroidia bacterium]
MRKLIFFLILALGFSLNTLAQHHIQDTCHRITDQDDQHLEDSMSKQELLAIKQLKLQNTCGNSSNPELASFSIILAPLNGPAEIFTSQNSFSQSCLRAILNAKSGSSILIERARFNLDGNAYFVRPQIIYIR